MRGGKEEELLNRYERWMRSVDRSPNTIRQRIRMAGKIVEQFPDLNEVGPGDLADWLSESEGLARWSKATYYSGIRAFFKWLTLSNLIDNDPTASPLFERPKARQGIPKPLSPAEIDLVLGAATGNTRTWVMLALLAGLRAAEIAALSGQNVNEDNIILRGKGDKEAAIPTHPDLWSLAQAYPRRGWWFPSPAHDGHVAGSSVSIMIGRLFRRLSIDGSIHRCRHTYGSSLLEVGMDLRYVQKAMRHESPATTAIYTAIRDDKLRSGIGRLHFGGAA